MTSPDAGAPGNRAARAEASINHTSEPARPRAYRGRFAPSPSGPLHLGSLATALASRLEAIRHQGEWLLRIENIDPPREVPGAASAILRTLEQHGFAWDGPVVYQRDRTSAYADAAECLLSERLAYPCACTRRDLIRNLQGLPHYPGTCRTGLPPGRRARALRVLTHDRPIGFDDRLQGWHAAYLESEGGDFVIKRADGYYAYQLAVVVDDAWQGISDVVRGIDLLESTPRQRHLQDCLGLLAPRYAHLPLVVGREGTKLSKSAGAAALDTGCPGENLWRALWALGQQPPRELRTGEPRDLWAWAGEHWALDALRGVTTCSAPIHPNQ